MLGPTHAGAGTEPAGWEGIVSDPRREAMVPHLESGQVLAGRYAIDAVVGRGGMGTVYAARNQNSGRRVALKVIVPHADRGGTQRVRFLREAKAANAIGHPNVIEVLDAFEEPNGMLVMVMDLLEGCSFKHYLAERGALRLHEVATIFGPVLDALIAAHRGGIVHRDLKPDNLFLHRRGHERVPVLLDFGIAKMLSPDGVDVTHSEETATGALLGTPHYMSYEQAMSARNIDARTDVWSLGIMLFEALAGRRPVAFDNLGEMYAAFLTGDFPRIADAIPALPDDVAALIDGCLVRERERRVDDLTSLRDALRAYEDQTQPGAMAGGIVLRHLPTPSADAVLDSTTIGTARSASVPVEAAGQAQRFRLVAGTLVVVTSAVIGITVASIQTTRLETPTTPMPPPSPRGEAPYLAEATSTATTATPTVTSSARPVPAPSSSQSAGTKRRGAEALPAHPTVARPALRPATSPSVTSTEPAAVEPAPPPRRGGLPEEDPWPSSTP